MSYTCLRYHLVFSTKDRRPWISPDLLPRLCEYLGGMIRQQGGYSMLINGPQDHLHVITGLSPTISVSDALRDLKANSTNWIHETFPDLKVFCWQDGYAAFTISPSVLDRAVKYVQNQQEHHKKVTFEEELKWLLENHGIKYDPRYI